MCSTCCALGGDGMYCVQQFVFVRVVANRPCGGVGVEGEFVLCKAVNRNDSEWFGVPQDAISDIAQNENRN